MSAQIIPMCNHHCKAEELPEGDSKHFLDCSVWPWNADPSTRRDADGRHAPSALSTLPSSAACDRWEGVARIATVIVTATMIVTLLTLLGLYTGLVKP